MMDASEKEDKNQGFGDFGSHAGIFLFFNLTTPSTFDFLAVCPDRYWAENLFCYPEDMMADTAAFDWIGRTMIIDDPIVFGQ